MNGNCCDNCGRVIPTIGEGELDCGLIVSKYFEKEKINNPRQTLCKTCASKLSAKLDESVKRYYESKHV